MLTCLNDPVSCNVTFSLKKGRKWATLHFCVFLPPFSPSSSPPVPACSRVDLAIPALVPVMVSTPVPNIQDTTRSEDKFHYYCSKVETEIIFHAKSKEEELKTDRLTSPVASLSVSDGRLPRPSHPPLRAQRPVPPTGSNAGHTPCAHTPPPPRPHTLSHAAPCPASRTGHGVVGLCDGGRNPVSHLYTHTNMWRLDYHLKHTRNLLVCYTLS